MRHWPLDITPYALQVAAADHPCQDRALCRPLGDGYVVAVADGAGGMGGGDEAADNVVENLEHNPPSAEDIQAPSHWVNRLQQLDDRIARHPDVGQTTAVVLGCRTGRVWGASVGDSEAWHVRGDGTRRLTGGQRRKPFLGSGHADIRSFTARIPNGRLLVATDGLFRYVPQEQIRSIAAEGELNQVCQGLVLAAALPTGPLRDDIALVLLELRPR